MDPSWGDISASTAVCGILKDTSRHNNVGLSTFAAASSKIPRGDEMAAARCLTGQPLQIAARAAMDFRLD
jgi:hypothetical protein